MPIAWQRRISASASSMPVPGIWAMPTRRFGAFAQKSFWSQSLYARIPARWNSRSVPSMKWRIVRCGG